jgi:hypothetical protein
VASRRTSFPVAAAAVATTNYARAKDCSSAFCVFGRLFCLQVKIYLPLSSLLTPLTMPVHDAAIAKSLLAAKSTVTAAHFLNASVNFRFPKNLIHVHDVVA